MTLRDRREQHLEQQEEGTGMEKRGGRPRREKAPRGRLWSTLFWLLLACNVLVLAGAVWLVFGGANPAVKPYAAKPADQPLSSFEVMADRENINRTIEHYIAQIKQEAAGSPNLDYAVRIEQDIELTGTLVVFDRNVALNAAFEPEVQPNGDLILLKKTMNLGNFPLPAERVLKYVASQYELPDWVTVEPKKERIVLAFSQMKTENELGIGVKEMDSEQNRYRFEIRLYPDVP